MDPNCNVTARPIAQAVEYATPRKAYAPVKTEPQSECLVCRFPSGNEQTIVQLACCRPFCADECIELWLKQSGSSPTCRAKITGPSPPLFSSNVCIPFTFTV